MPDLLTTRQLEQLLTQLNKIQTAIDTQTAAIRAGNVPPTTKGSFTCGAAATTTVTQPIVKSTSVILLVPTNAAAGTLQAGLTHLYISAKTAGASFAVTTANAAAAAGTETFDYVVVN
jgi:hypothetical protein